MLRNRIPAAVFEIRTQHDTQIPTPSRGAVYREKKATFRHAELAFLSALDPFAAKAKEIQRLFEMIPLDPRWYLPSQLDNNPLAWIVEVNGCPIDARWAPREIQEEVYRKGLIPYLPDRRE